MNTINIYFRKEPVGYKWIPGDRHLVRFIKSLFKPRGLSGIEKVFVNLCRGFDELGVKYAVNIPFKNIKPNEPVVVLGDGLYNGKNMLAGYDKPNPIIAGIGLITHPAEWPNLINEYPVAKYLQHCDWANNIYVRYYGDNHCAKWPAGIDTQKWVSDTKIEKTFDVLVYNKLRFNLDKEIPLMYNPIIAKLKEMGLTYREVVYGHYLEQDYFALLQQCKAMIFLSEHETQGFATCEAMAMDIPIIAWNQGYCQDPKRFEWNDPVIPTASVPFFDETCGVIFTDAADFANKITAFWGKAKTGKFAPRNYILNNLTLKKSAERMLEIIQEVYPD